MIQKRMYREMAAKMLRQKELKEECLGIIKTYLKCTDEQAESVYMFAEREAINKSCSMEYAVSNCVLTISRNLGIIQ